MNLHLIPHPAEDAIIQSEAEINPGDRLDAIILAIELLLRVDALLLSTAFLRMGIKDDKVRLLLMQNKQLGLGYWHALLHSCAYRLPSTIFPQIQEWVRQMDRKCRDRKWDICCESPFQTIMAARNWRSHSEARRKKLLLETRAGVATCCLRKILMVHPPLGHFQGTPGRGLTYYCEGTAQDCGDLIRDGSEAGYPNIIFLFSGVGKRAFQYGSAEGVGWSDQKPMQHLGEMVSQIASVETFPATASPHLLEMRLRETTRKTLDKLIQLKIYRPEVFVHRLETEELIRSFGQGQQKVLFVEGPPGAGKTSWLCNFAEGRHAIGCSTLFATADHLGETNFPNCLNTLLQVSGQISTALQRLSGISLDHQVYVLLDDLSSLGQEEVWIPSLLRWAEHSDVTSVLVVATLRSDRAELFFDHHPEALFVGNGKRFQLSPLSEPELIELAERLPVDNVDMKVHIVEQRMDAAIRLCELADASARRPGLAINILEYVDPKMIADSHTPFDVYNRLYQELIIEIDHGRPRHHQRGAIARGVAIILMNNNGRPINLESPVLRALPLFDTQSGARTEAYEALLSIGILTETFDGIQSSVHIPNQRFAEFLGAMSVSLDDDAASALLKWCESSRDWPQALGLVVHVLSRILRTQGELATIMALRGLGHWRISLLRHIALTDGGGLQRIFSLVVNDNEQEAQGLVKWMLESGECRLAARTARILATCTQNRHVQDESQFLSAQAHFELDDYASAIADLASMTSARINEIARLRGDIAVAQEHWKEADAHYQIALSPEGAIYLHTRWHALRGSGYCRWKLGDAANAVSMLRESVNQLRLLGESRELCEALSDLGEVLGDMGFLIEARGSLEESLYMNQRAACLVGIGIVEGLLGELDLREFRLEEAGKRLRRALRTANRTGNRWRQAWTMMHLAKLHELLGESNRSESMVLHAMEIRNALLIK